MCLCVCNSSKLEVTTKHNAGGQIAVAAIKHSTLIETRVPFELYDYIVMELFIHFNKRVTPHTALGYIL